MKTTQNIKTINANKALSEKIRRFLWRRGLELEGGSFDSDGALWLGIKDVGTMTYSPYLGKEIKEFLNVPKLVLNGIVY